MDNHASAHNALQLHGDKTLSKFGLSVLVSDPAAKKQRTDAGETTLFVGGLSPETTEEEVREQFAKVSATKDVPHAAWQYPLRQARHGG